MGLDQLASLSHARVGHVVAQHVDTVPAHGDDDVAVARQPGREVVVPLVVRDRFPPGTARPPIVRAVPPVAGGVVPVQEQHDRIRTVGQARGVVHVGAELHLAAQAGGTERTIAQVVLAANHVVGARGRRAPRGRRVEPRCRHRNGTRGPASIGDAERGREDDVVVGDRDHRAEIARRDRGGDRTAVGDEDVAEGAGRVAAGHPHPEHAVRCSRPAQRCRHAHPLDRDVTVTSNQPARPKLEHSYGSRGPRRGTGARGRRYRPAAGTPRGARAEQQRRRDRCHDERNREPTPIPHLSVILRLDPAPCSHARGGTSRGRGTLTIAGPRASAQGLRASRSWMDGARSPATPRPPGGRRQRDRPGRRRRASPDR